MSNATVKSAATQKSALKKNSVSLLGVFGPKSDLRALMRMSSGRVKEVKPGSRVSSGTVVAIDPDGVMLRQSGQTRRIVIPGS
ncbi:MULTISPECIES: hypothetical protein [unclassified Ruegeria]|uniref:hypothetical protein n=1 Tax=unclassified Ruegeria TaxID=2625375 RepID=UPI00147E4083|nr:MULTISPECIES: hypothetical protein [unclassified Ruegeria]MBO9410547.1 hypothetical protein [Ruegeria sp. R8_1]MBO9414234.1 hypothetical protein [Ruegeria sp. R8_2]